MLDVKLYIFTFFYTALIICIAAIFIIAYDRSRRPITGRHGLLGEIGRTKQDIPAGKLGKIYIFGEYWEAICDESLTKGQAVQVVEVHDKYVKVVASDLLPEPSSISI